MEQKEYFPKPEEIVKPPEIEGRLLSIREVAKLVDLSTHRIRRLLNSGRIQGEKLRRGRGKGFPWIWQTSVEEVRRYLSAKPSPSEYGKRGGRPRKEALGT